MNKKKIKKWRNRRGRVCRNEDEGKIGANLEHHSWRFRSERSNMRETGRALL